MILLIEEQNFMKNAFEWKIKLIKKNQKIEIQYFLSFTEFQWQQPYKHDFTEPRTKFLENRVLLKNPIKK